MNLKPLPQGSGISSVVEDTSPQLGGNLANNEVASIDSDGSIIVTSISGGSA